MKMNLELQTCARYKSFTYILGLVLNASLGSFLIGYKIAEINLLIINLLHVYSWSESETNLYTGLLNALVDVGAIFGAMLSGNYFKNIGRKWGLIIADIFGIGGSIICVFEGVGAFPQIIGRFLSGVAAGINCQLVPLYINELTPHEISGFMGSFFQSFMNGGILISYLMCLNIPNEQEDEFYDTTDDWWRVVFVFPTFSCLIRVFFLLTYYDFDTPYSLVKRNKTEEVSIIIKRIYNEEFIDEEVEKIQGRIISNEELSYKDLFTENKSRIFLGMLLMAAQQLSGVDAVISESSILYNYSCDNTEVKILTVMNSIILIIASTISGLTSDKFGRRSLILYGNGACIICLYLMGIFQEFPSDTMKEISIFMTYMFLLSFGSSLGPVIYLYEPEILPDEGISLAVIVNWFCCGAVVFLTPYVIVNFGIPPIYYLFGTILFICHIYFFFFLKETKGKTHAEIDSMFSGSQNENSNDEKKTFCLFGLK